MVLVLGGPTSAGKTTAALRVAAAFDAVIVSADAMQVYRGLDVGTGKATAAEQAAAPHFGLDVIGLDGRFDAAGFVALADGVLSTHPRVIVVGGTSLYLRAFLQGLVPTPPVDPALRSSLEALESPWEALQAVDPVLAARLHRHDRVRIVRGLEVFRQTGEQLSALQEAHARQPPRVPHVAMWLDQEDLQARIDARVLAMVDAGYVQETRAALRDHPRDCAPLRAFAYRHLVAHILDDLPLDAAVSQTQRDTRRFARKQRTWMRGLGFPRFEGADIEPALLEAASRAFGCPAR